MKNKRRRRLNLLQKFLGVVAIILTIYVVIGTKDLTLLFLYVPLGLYMIFTKKKIF